MNKKVSRVAILGNHPPRRCGIATFTQDISRALRTSGLEVDVVAMSDQASYAYPSEVAFDIAQDDLPAYAAAAQSLNSAGYDLLNVQHEYGIFGGSAGSHLLTLLRNLKIPIVTTLHTVLQYPNPDQRAVLDEIIGLSQSIVVMSEKARSLLHSGHGIAADKVIVIPHGIPDLPETPAEKFKAELGLQGKKVVLTFGLLSPDKGIEFAIEAMAQVPESTYVVLGQTHPHVLRHSGEAYRKSLEAKAEEFGVADRVRFIDRYVDDAELGRFLRMCDVYVTPYLKEEQITSGTLAYTVGNGKAVVSTPYWHAQELLAEDRGILVPMRDANALGEALQELTTNDERRHQIEQNAMTLGKGMRWPAVGKAYVNCFEQALRDSNALLSEIIRKPWVSKGTLELPRVQLSHLEILTNDTGIYQHATYNIPNRTEGWCIDDNARALLLTVQLMDQGYDDPRLPLFQTRYLSFCAHALNSQTGRFRNFMSFDHQWLETEGSEDSHGRSLWCLATTARKATGAGVRGLARDVYEKGAQAVTGFTSPRAWAYSCLGFVQMSDYRLTEKMVRSLMSLYDSASSEDWPWFEPIVAYANARLSQALILGGKFLGDHRAMNVGLLTLNWLSAIQNDNGMFSPIGNEGFYVRGGTRAIWDQQPIEATAHVSACLSAFEVTGDPKWKVEAERAFGWFLGKNILGVSVVDEKTGGCGDGLERHGVSANQGSESTISYLSALAELLGAPAAANRRTML